MIKAKWAFSIVAVALITLFFQNCGQAPSSLDGNAGIFEDSSHDPIDDLPPEGTINNPGAPTITSGLLGKITYSEPAGYDLGIAVSDGTDVSYEWVVNGKKNVGTLPQQTINDIGRVDVSVTAFFPNGQKSTSRAIYTISRYSMVGGSLKYLNPATATYEAVIGADLATFKLIGTHYGADASQVFCQKAALAGADVDSFSLPFDNIDNFAYDDSTLYGGCLKWGTPNAFAAIKTNHQDSSDASVFFKSSGKYYFLRGTDSPLEMGAPLIGEIPFVPANEANLTSVIKAPRCCFVTDGIKSAKTSSINGRPSGPHVYPVTFALNTAAFSADLNTFTHLGQFTFKDKNRVYVFKTDGTLELITPSKIGSFIAVDGTLFKDSDKVYKIPTEGPVQVIAGAKAASFMTVQSKIYKDSDHVYLDGTYSGFAAVPGADPSTFVFIKDKMYRDASHAWILDYSYKGLYLIDNMDMASFVYLGENISGTVFADKNQIFAAEFNNSTQKWDKAALNIPSPLTVKMVFSTSYLYTPTTLYFVDDLITTAVPDVAPTNPKLVSGYAITVGGKLVFKKAVVPGIVAGDFTQVGGPYWKTSTAIYYLAADVKILTNNVSTFRIFNPTQSNYYSTDGTIVWYSNTPLTMADVATFVVTGSLSAEDKGYKYSISFATKKP